MGQSVQGLGEGEAVMPVSRAEESMSTGDYMMYYYLPGLGQRQ